MIFNFQKCEAYTCYVGRPGERKMVGVVRGCTAPRPGIYYMEPGVCVRMHQVRSSDHQHHSLKNTMNLYGGLE